MVVVVVVAAKRVVTTLAPVVCKAQSEAMSDIENLNTRTDTATETNENGHGLRVRTSVKASGFGFGAGTPGLNHSEAKGLRVSQGEGLASRKAKRFLAAAAVTIGVLASTAAPASAGTTGGIPLSAPIVGVTVAASGNLVQGNRIGTDASGTAVTGKVTIEHTSLCLPGVDLCL